MCGCLRREWLNDLSHIALFTKYLWTSRVQFYGNVALHDLRECTNHLVTTPAVIAQHPLESIPAHNHMAFTMVDRIAGNSPISAFQI